MARGLAFTAGVKDGRQDRSLPVIRLYWNAAAPLALSPHTPFRSRLRQGTVWSAPHLSG
jgi:hypothetical protein